MAQKTLHVFKMFLMAWALMTWRSGIVIAQDYRDALNHFFLGRQPSAKAEAMGKSMIATATGAFSSFYNPATISQNEGLFISASSATPFYLADHADYKFIGATYKLGNYGVLGLSLYRFSFGESIATTSMTNPAAQGGKFTPTTSMYTLTFSAETFKNLYFGMNVNSVRDKGAAIGKSYPIDLGLLKIFNCSKNQKISLGASLYNVTNSKILYDVNDNRDIKEALPVSFHAGASCQLFWGSSKLNSFELNTFGILLQLEYQDLFNSKFHDGFRTGAELSFIEIIYIRFGLYREDINDHGFPAVNKNNLTDFTYGLGIEIPIDKFTRVKIPLNARLDITTMKQPSYIKNFDRWENFSVYNLSVNWIIKD
ncbi:MAG: hypothetical protein ONB46_25805 [candidate division KSB1 bacterium]|nr:hypothetical protein [candidate division KSB1 bacterium]MDZ7369326.1 hypothetical protein [candidate division KSB1 bacterium]MDZ7407372.1 hypothetical protein [candidate division KSB1 bacterium]